MPRFPPSTFTKYLYPRRTDDPACVPVRLDLWLDEGGYFHIMTPTGPDGLKRTSSFRDDTCTTFLLGDPGYRIRIRIDRGD
jgi:hypothetical protein